MKLADYLAAENLTAKAFALRAGVPPSTITRLLSGARSPGLELLRKIMVASHGKVTPNDFLDDYSSASRTEAAQ